MQPSDKEELRQIVMEACHHVLPQCGLPISDEATNGGDSAFSDELASLVAFTAEDLRGTLTLVAPLSLMRGCYPLPLGHDDSSKIDLFDWSGEIANRLMGRIKCVLVRYGVDVLPSAPKVMWAEPRLLGPSARTVCQLSYLVDHCRVGVRVDAICPEGVPLLQGAMATDESLAEGEVLLF